MSVSARRWSRSLRQPWRDTTKLPQCRPQPVPTTHSVNSVPGSSRTRYGATSAMSGSSVPRSRHSTSSAGSASNRSSSPGTEAPSSSAQISSPSSPRKPSNSFSAVSAPAMGSAVAHFAERRAAVRRRLEHLRLRRVRGRLLPGRRHGLIAALGLGRFLRGLGRLRRSARAVARRAPRVDHHHRALDEDAARVDADEIAADLEGERGARLEHQRRSRLQVDLGAGVVGDLGAGLALQVLADVEREPAADRLVAVTADVDVVVAADVLEAVLADGEVVLVADLLDPIVLDELGLVLLGVDVELLRARLVLEADLVEAGALVGLGLDAAARLVVRQRPGRHRLAVVERADHHRVVGIALQEVDQDLLADARQVEHAPFLAGERLRHAHPAGAVLVGLAVAVPVELQLDAAVLVGVDVLAGRADHARGLRALHDRLGREPRRPEGRRARDRLQAAAEARGLASGGEGAHGGGVAHRGDDVFGVVGGARVIHQLDEPPRRDLPRPAGTEVGLVLRVGLLDARLRVLRSLGGRVVLAGIVVDLVFREIVLLRGVRKAHALHRQAPPPIGGGGFSRWKPLSPYSPASICRHKPHEPRTSFCSAAAASCGWNGTSTAGFLYVAPESISTTVFLPSAYSWTRKIPSCSSRRQTKLKSVSRYWTLNSLFG